MCGRYAMAEDPAALAVEFDVDVAPDFTIAPDFNMAPTKPGVIVVDREVRDEPTAYRQRTLELGRWGLIPSWAKDPSIASRMINARSETVSDKPAYRAAFRKRRCLVPADGYYEWYTPVSPAGKVAKQPFYIHPSDGSILAMAGIFEWWRDPAVDSEDAWRLTFAILTTSATDDIGRIHERMPVAIPRQGWTSWLSPDTDIREVEALMSPAGSVGLSAYPVSTSVNSVRNNGPSLIEPIAPS